MLSLTRSKYLFLWFFYSSILRAHTRRCSVFYVRSNVGTWNTGRSVNVVREHSVGHCFSKQLRNVKNDAQLYFYLHSEKAIFIFDIAFRICQLNTESGSEWRFALFRCYSYCYANTEVHFCTLWIHKTNWRLFAAISLELSRRFRTHPILICNLIRCSLSAACGRALSCTYRIY